MENFEILNFKFSKFENDLQQKIQLINKKFENDSNIINKEYDSYEKNYSNGLNSYREALLSILKTSLICAINKVGDVVSKTNSFETNDYKSLLDNIKKDFLNFKYKNRPIVRDLNIFKFNFSKPLDLFKLNKYSEFIYFKHRTFNIENPTGFYTIKNASKEPTWYSLTNDKILICSMSKANFKTNVIMLVIDKNGKNFTVSENVQ